LLGVTRADEPDAGGDEDDHDRDLDQDDDVVDARRFVNTDDEER